MCKTIKMSSTVPTKYRDNGAIGALLDEYEKALNDLIIVIKIVGLSRLF